MITHVRPAAEADAPRLALIGRATFLETFAAVLDGSAVLAHCDRAHGEAWYRDALASGARAWLAEVEPGAAPVGYALLAAADLPGMAADGRDLELKRIYVLSRFHGQRLGAQLMAAALAAARERGAARVMLGVYAGNSRALAFYAAHGFVQVAERSFRVGDREYEDVVLAAAIP